MTDTQQNFTPVINVKKFLDNEDVSLHGAFESCAELFFEIDVEADKGTVKTPPDVQVCTMTHDAKPCFTCEAILCSVNENVHDKKAHYIYQATLALSMLCACTDSESGLFGYCIRVRDTHSGDCFYTSSINNVDFDVVKNLPPTPFRLLLYKKEFSFPSGFDGGIMYQIFPDRFCDGGVKLPVREDAEFNPDWYDGIPQYGEYPGAFVKNNMFFGGNLYGIISKLDYLSELGVTCLYLNPIFTAYSNHKYDTGNYMEVDKMFGGDKALAMLIDKAHEKGMKVILDGVFNHTGDNSIYFDKYKKHTHGAYSCKTSPYRKWYNFTKYPDKYESWWDIDILPKLNQNEKSCREYFTGKGGVCEKYAEMGIDGWRLDVADELPDVFLDEFRSAVKQRNPKAIIIGEVWENASDKVAYGKLRRYFQGDQLDSVMNYPFKNAVLDFILHGDSRMLYNTLIDIYSSYPKKVCDNLMNIVGTHDTPRILTELSGVDTSHLSNAQLSVYTLPHKERELAVKRLMVASVIQYTVYGFPSVYYGDEAGSEGGHDPFCRKPFPWGREDASLMEHYIRLGKIRHSESCFCGGDFKVIYATCGTICYSRSDGKSKVYVMANAGKDVAEMRLFDTACDTVTDLVTGKIFTVTHRDDGSYINLDGVSAVVIRDANP